MDLVNKYCIIVPTYQSSETLLPLIYRIRNVTPEIPLIIVDDGSTDDSEKVFNQINDVTIVRHPVNRGKGAAIKSGINKAKQMKCTCGIFIDSDLQHAPEKIPEFIASKEYQNVRMILGRRSFTLWNMPFHRFLSNTVTSFIISFRTMRRVHDSQCGFRLIDLDSIQTYLCADDGFQFESEFLIRALTSGVSFVEIEIPTIYNNSHSSIRNIRDTGRFILLILKSYIWT
ncbi:MAG: glycosyltransferase family 2 protein [Candidatus Marinimicrobia bacterium]|nr:glycosyltransferase family 2 protein [Candidatus Neomarinimicrobiota bacterium]